MPLSTFLYRCPRCGEDPIEGQGADRARCPSCRTRYSRGSGGCRLEVREDGEETGREIPAWELSRAIDGWGGPLTAATDQEGRIRYRARARVRWAREHHPVRFRGVLVGFAEKLGKPEQGVLEANEAAVIFRPREGPAYRWKLLDLSALQTSSSSVQLALGTGEVVQSRFIEDSSRRWEKLLRHLLQEAYWREGRGEIVEFQPRIVTR